MSERSRFAATASARMLLAAGDERAALTVAAGLRARVGRELEDERDAFADPLVCLRALCVEVGGVGRAPLLDDVDGHDVELHGGPLLGADQRDAEVDRIE